MKLLSKMRVCPSRKVIFTRDKPPTTEEFCSSTTIPDPHSGYLGWTTQSPTFKYNCLLSSIIRLYQTFWGKASGESALLYCRMRFSFLPFLSPHFLVPTRLSERRFDFLSALPASQRYRLGLAQAGRGGKILGLAVRTEVYFAHDRSWLQVAGWPVTAFQFLSFPPAKHRIDRDGKRATRNEQRISYFGPR